MHGMLDSGERKPADKPVDDLLDQTGVGKKKPPRIRCPKCGWEPGPGDRWLCNRPRGGAMCGTVWNTFQTRGKCPTCTHQWQHTSCLRCHRWSLHEDWYGE